MQDAHVLLVYFPLSLFPFILPSINFPVTLRISHKRLLPRSHFNHFPYLQTLPQCLPTFIFFCRKQKHIHTHIHTAEARAMVIRMRHEASASGHQLTEVDLGCDGAQEVSHCPAAEPATRVLQSPLPSSHPCLSCFSFWNVRCRRCKETHPAIPKNKQSCVT